jgi:hypothetical protein
VFCGAGDTDYINNVGDLIETEFRICKKTPTSVYEVIKESILTIYRDQISPFWRIRDHDAPQIFLVIAVRFDNDQQIILWKVSETSISVCRRSAFVGIGAETANALTSWLIPRIQPLAVTQLLAKEILGETKRTIKDCGGMTHLCSIPNQGTISSTALGASDEGPFLWGLNKSFAGAIAATVDKHVNESNFKQALAAMEGELKVLRKRTNKVPIGQEWLMLFSGGF